MFKIAVKKSNNKIVSFGTEDMGRFSLDEFNIMEVDILELPDELRFCKYENGLVLVDEIYKQQILQQEAEQKQKTKNARQYLQDNNPADAVSVPTLRERVKRLEALLGIYKWL